MTQGLADDGEGDLSVAGDGSPGVAGDIEGQRTGKAALWYSLLYSRSPERMGRRKGEEAV